MARKLGVGGTNPKDYGARCKQCSKLATPHHWRYYPVGDKNIELCNSCFDRMTKPLNGKPAKTLAGQKSLL